MSEGVITLTKTLLRSFHGTGCGLLIYCLLASTISFTQTALNSQAAKPYNIEVSVDEIRVIFHASDASGQPVGDLTPSELDLFDNESGPGQIVAMQKLKERPLRIAFVVVQGSTLQPPPPTPVTVNVSGILSLVSSVVNEGLTLATDGLVTGDTAALVTKVGSLIAGVFDVVPQELDDYDRGTLRVRHMELMRSWMGVSAFDREALRIIVKACVEASRVREDLADIINVAIEELLRKRFELPGFTTLFRAATAGML